MSKVIFLIVGVGSSFRSLVEKQFVNIIAPIYGNQTEALQKIFHENSDRTCELMFDENDKKKENPLGLIVYKNQLSEEYAEYGINKGLEVKTLFLINAEENSGKGLETVLLSRTLRKCIENKAENLFLTVSSSASFSSVDFFKKLHFTEKHYWRGKFEDKKAAEYLLNRNVYVRPITLQEKYLKKIIDGSKTKEGRTNTGIFTKIREGEIVRFFNPSTKLQVYTEIVSVIKYNGFYEMLEGRLKDYLPEIDNLNTAVEIYHKIPGYREKANKFGVLGFNLRKIEIGQGNSNRTNQNSTVIEEATPVMSSSRKREPHHIYFDEKGNKIKKQKRF